MDDPVNTVQSRDMMRNAIEISTRLFLVAALALWCFLIFKPFLMPVLWGMIIAVALSPWFDRIAALLGERRKLTSVLLVLVVLAALIVPAIVLSESFFSGLKWLSVQVQKDAIQVPPPPAKVAEWPLIGDELFETWTRASENLEQVLERFGPQLKSFGVWLI